MIIYYYKQLFIFMNVEKEIEEIKKIKNDLKKLKQMENIYYIDRDNGIIDAVQTITEFLKNSLQLNLISEDISDKFSSLMNDAVNKFEKERFSKKNDLEEKTKNLKDYLIKNQLVNECSFLNFNKLKEDKFEKLSNFLLEEKIPFKFDVNKSESGKYSGNVSIFHYDLNLLNEINEKIQILSLKNNFAGNVHRISFLNTIDILENENFGKSFDEILKNKSKNKLKP